VEEKDEELAWEIAKKYKDKDFSYTNAIKKQSGRTTPGRVGLIR